MNAIEPMTKARKTYGWEDLPDEALLQVRIRDLNLQIPGSGIEPFVDRLYDELAAQGITYEPVC
jgi:hypothetical protein